MNSKILLVDDDEDILDLLKYNLVKDGFDVHALSSSADMMRHADSFQPQLIVLDLMMPGVNGIELCRQIRKNERLKNVYVFFMTAKSDDYYRHATFNVGGDDFIEKVIGIKPLINKINAVLRQDLVIRKRIMQIKAGNLEMFRGVETVYLDGNKVLLSKPEFEILFFLAQNPGRKISLREIIATLWGSETYVDKKSVTSFLDSLQKHFGDFLVSDRGSEYYAFKF